MRVKAAAVPAYSPSTNIHGKSTTSNTKEKTIIPESVFPRTTSPEMDVLEYHSTGRKIISTQEQLALDLLFGPSENSGTLMLNQLQIGIITDIKA